MVSYIPLITIAVASGVLIMALINFLSARKNMQKQSEEQMNKLRVLNEQQIYQRLTEVRLSLQKTEEFTRMAAESHLCRTLCDSGRQSVRILYNNGIS